MKVFLSQKIFYKFTTSKNFSLPLPLPLPLSLPLTYLLWTIHYKSSPSESAHSSMPFFFWLICPIYLVLQLVHMFSNIWRHIRIPHISFPIHLRLNISWFTLHWVKISHFSVSMKNKSLFNRVYLSTHSTYRCGQYLILCTLKCLIRYNW